MKVNFVFALELEVNVKARNSIQAMNIVMNTPTSEIIHMLSCDACIENLELKIKEIDREIINFNESNLISKTCDCATCNS